jgi:predicted phage terminase large subunit-like protein
MTRWAEGDLAGRLISQDANKEWYVLSMPACLNEATQEMLCPALLSWKRYQALLEYTSHEILMANYQQEPQTVKGLMYPELATYKAIPIRDGRADFDLIFAYTDTADTGADSTTCIVAGRCQGQAYVLDVLFTDAPMEVTEPDNADLLVRNKVEVAKFESNNGGRGYGRNVERLCWERHKSRGTKFIFFTQTENKAARILTHSSSAMRNVLFPEGWEKKWPKFYKALAGYKRVGSNAHDDAPDCLTGIVEMLEGGISTRKTFFSGRGAVG